jgi:hypothetical protein
VNSLGRISLTVVLVFLLALAVGYIAYNYLLRRGGVGFDVYIISENGQEIPVNQSMTLSIRGMTLYYGTTKVTDRLVMKFWVQPTWSGDPKPQSVYVTVPAGSSLRRAYNTSGTPGSWQTYPTYEVKATVPLDTKSYIGGLEYAVFASDMTSLPSGTYRIERQVSGTATADWGTPASFTASGYVDLKWTQDTLTITAGFEGSALQMSA